MNIFDKTIRQFITLRKQYHVNESSIHLAKDCVEKKLPWKLIAIDKTTSVKLAINAVEVHMGSVDNVIGQQILTYYFTLHLLINQSAVQSKNAVYALIKYSRYFH